MNDVEAMTNLDWLWPMTSSPLSNIFHTRGSFDFYSDIDFLRILETKIFKIISITTVRIQSLY